MCMFLKNLFNSGNSKRFNILVRTSNRPNYFRACYESIMNQTFQNFKIFVSCDNNETCDYLKKYSNINVILLSKPSTDNFPAPDIPRGNNLAKFPYNIYLNQLMKQVRNGYILYLDDDDILMHPTSLQIIANHISGKDDLIFWRVQFPYGKLIPEDEYFGGPPEFWHISGIGFAFHSKYIPFAQWDGWKGGDYAVATKLYRTVPNKKYIDQVLTGLQRTEGWGGFGKHEDKKLTDEKS